MQALLELAGDAGQGPKHAFDNPLGAEIHLVINDHGPALREYMRGVIQTCGGDCKDEGPPPFLPSALAQGEPGPNTCRLMQFEILEQYGPVRARDL